MTQTTVSIAASGAAIALMTCTIAQMRRTQPQTRVTVAQYGIALALTGAAVGLAFTDHVLASLVAITLLPTVAALAWTDLVYRAIPLPLVVLTAVLGLGTQFWIHPVLDVAPWLLAGVAFAVAVRVVAPRIGTTIGLADLVVLALAVTVFHEAGLLAAATLFALPAILRRVEVPVVLFASLAVLTASALVTIV